MNDRYEKMLRGAVLFIIWLARKESMTSIDSPNTVRRGVLERALAARAMRPEGRDMPLALDWLEQAEYVTVDWAMDTRLDYDSVTITKKGLDLMMDRNARRTEPNITLPERF